MPSNFGALGSVESFLKPNLEQDERLMRIFISWSGHRSRAAAVALKRWIPDTIQQVETWMSEHDIDAGSRWCSELVRTLEECNVGIICLTPENQDSPWLLFEAGCLAKSGNVSRVVPYLHGLSPSDVRFPLAQFQAIESTKAGTFKLMQVINGSAALNIENDRLERLFEKWWPDLEESLKQIHHLKGAEPPARSERDLLEELLGLARDIASRNTSLEPSQQNRPVEITIGRSLSETGGLIRLEYSAEQTVSAFLDHIFHKFPENVDIPPYEYGTFWVLHDIESGRKYDDIGREYCRSQGRIRDERSIESIGIKSGTRLQAVSAR